MYVYLESIHVYVQGDECTFTWKVYNIHVYVQGDECTFTWQVYMFMYRVMSVRLPGKYTCLCTG